MLNYKNLHSKIEEQETNAIYYLLRKFGLLQETIILSKVSSVTGKYGVYTYDTENDKLIISNVEPTTIYKIVFTILDANNNARTVSVTGKETNGSVNITVPTIATDELLLEKIKVIITYAQEIVQDYIVDEPSEVIGTSGEYITIADLSNNDLPDRFILSFDYKSNYESRVGLFSKENFTGNPNYSVFVGMPTTSYHNYGFRTTSTQATNVSGNIGEYSHFIIERDRDVFKYARNGNVLGSKTINWFDNYDYIVGMMQWGTDGEHSVKNVQMVALPDEINLNVVSDKDVIKSSETATVTATLTKNGVAVTGETLNYEILHNGSVISSGSVVTDGNGEAEITYTGTGVGEVNITVEYGIFLQETYELYDTYFYDNDVDSDIWNLTNATLNRSLGYSELTESTTGTTANIITKNTLLMDSSHIIEFDLYQVDGLRTNGTIFIRNGGGGSTLASANLYQLDADVGEWVHLKIVFDETNSKLLFYVDDSSTPVERTLTVQSNYRLAFYTSGDCTTLRYKNLKVYSA